MNETNIVVYDIETTGLDKIQDQIIEIGAVKVNGQGEIIDKFQSFASLDRVQTLPDVIVELTGILEEDLNNQPSEKEAINKFLNWADKAIFIAHNGNRFDHPFFTHSSIINGLDGTNFFINDEKNQKKILLDSIKLAKLYAKEYNLSFEKHSLAYLTDILNLPYDKDAHHRADYDAALTAKLVKKLMESSLVKKEIFKSLKNLENLKK